MTQTGLVPYRAPAVERFDADWLLDPAEIAQRIGGTDFVPASLRDNPAAITAALLYGQEVGLGRMQSLSKIAVINGRPTLAAEAQRALVLAAGHEIWFEEMTVTRCIACGRRKGSDQITRVVWTMDDARTAQLAGKPPWRAYPRQMLVARASAELCRAAFPDVIGGLMATEELEDDPALAGVANGATVVEPERKTTRRRRPRRTSEPEPEQSTEGADTGEAAQGPEPLPDTASPAPSPEPEPPTAAEQALAAEAAAAPEPPVTEHYQRKIFALMREAGLPGEQREARLAYTARVIGREIASSNELTLSEAHRLIDDLEEIRSLPPEARPSRLSGAAGPSGGGAPAPAPAPDTRADSGPEPWRLRIGELMDEKEIGTSQERRSYAASVLGHEVTSLGELQQAEGEVLIEHLEQFDRDNPQTWPFPPGF